MAFKSKHRNSNESIHISSILLPHPTVPISILGSVGLFFGLEKRKENIEHMYIKKMI